MSLSNAPAAPLPKPKLPGVKEVWEQLLSDLFGKDVQDTATFSYEWVADQTGHFALGFELTYLLYWIAWLLGYKQGEVGLGLGVAVTLVFVVKEARDYFSQKAKADAAHSVFIFNGKEILRNCATAVFYIGVGALVAGTAIYNPLYGIISVFVAAPFVIWVGYKWLKVKVTFQQAGVPYLYRLANFPSPIDKETGEFIVAMSKPAADGDPPRTDHHLVLAGPLDSGKSSLAIGLGSEFGIRLGIGRYTTWAKLLQSVLRKDGKWTEPGFDEGRILWPWQTSDLLIVDDVDVLSDHDPGTATDVTRARTIVASRAQVLKQEVPPELLDALKYRRTVWVVGDVDDGELKRWRAIIADVIGIPDETVRTFRLNEKLVRGKPPTHPMPSPEKRVRQ